MPKTVYRCKEGMVCGANGRRYHFAQGDLVFEDHPVNPKRNPFFEEVSEYVERMTYQPSRRIRQEPVVEAATADPGEKRHRGWPTGSKDKPAVVATATEKSPSLPQKEKEQASPETQKEKLSNGSE